MVLWLSSKANPLEALRRAVIQNSCWKLLQMMLYDMPTMDKHFGSWIEADHNKAKRQHLDKTLPAGDKWSIQSALLCSLFPFFQLPESSKICFKTSSRHPFEKVSVAGPILAVKQVNFFLSMRLIKTMWHFKKLPIWLVLCRKHMHHLTITKLPLSAYFYLAIYRQHTFFTSIWQHCLYHRNNLTAFTETRQKKR